MIDALWFRLLGWAERIRREERGDGLVNWVVLAVGLAAAAAGRQAGTDRADGVLAAAGGAGAAMHADASISGNEVTVTVNGQAPHLFALPLILPSVAASASLPLEQYPADEQAITP